MELDDHVGAFVGDPDVVVTVDSNGVSERPSVEIVADLAEEFSVRAKFEELGGGGSVGGATGVAARGDEDGALGGGGDAHSFAEIKGGGGAEENQDGNGKGGGGGWERGGERCGGRGQR